MPAAGCTNNLIRMLKISQLLEYAFLKLFWLPGAGKAIEQNMVYYMPCGKLPWLL
jgi:hypothetical protein